jgi:hypothetical protein
MADLNEGIQANRVPLLTSSNYDMWKNRMHQYMLQTNYCMWEVIMNGPKSTPLPGPDAKDTGKTSASTDIAITDTDRKNRHNEFQALSTLLIAIPNEYQHKFRNFTNAKLLWAALEKRFGGSESTKRNQRDILKQQFENFKANKGEVLSQTFDRFNKLIGELSSIGAEIEKGDVNRKFLRSLNEEWTIYTVSYRQGDKMDDLEVDDLYNELRVFEAEVEAKNPRQNTSVNAAFVTTTTAAEQSSSSSTNASAGVKPQEGKDEVTTEAFYASHVNSGLAVDDLEQVNEDDLEEMDLKWQIAMLSVRTRRFIQRTGRKNFAVKRSDATGFDKSKVRCFDCQNLGHFARECPNKSNSGQRTSSNTNSNNNQGKLSSSTALVTQDGLGFDWSFQADEAATNQALMAMNGEDNKEEEDIPSEVLSDLCSPACIKQLKSYREHNKKICIELNYLSELEKKYVRAVASLEDQIKAYQENETAYADKIAIANWERDVAKQKADDLEIKIDEIKIENDQIRLTIKKYDKSSKTVDEIMKAQIRGHAKKGIGYNQVAPPFNDNYIPPKVDIEIPNSTDSESVDEEIEMEADPRVKSNETEVKIEQKNPSETTVMSNKGKEKMTEKSVKDVASSSKTHKQNNNSTFGQNLLNRHKNAKQNNKSFYGKNVGNQNARKQVNNGQNFSSMCSVKTCQCSCSSKSTSVSPDRGNQRNWNQLMVQRNGPNFFQREERKCYICGKVGHIARNCFHNKFSQPNNFNRGGVGFRRPQNSPPRFGRTAQRFFGNGYRFGQNNTGKALNQNGKFTAGTKTTGTSTFKKSTRPQTNVPKVEKEIKTEEKPVKNDSKVNPQVQKDTTGTSTFKKSTRPQTNVPKVEKEIKTEEKPVKNDSKVNPQVQTDTTGTSTSTSSIPKNAEINDNALEIKEFSYLNEKGEPKTTCAWVPKRN